jgi:hypothetical protein
MRVLSIRQPWASLIAAGRKTVELRSWSTNYRGPLLILAGSGLWRGEHDWPTDGPRGVAVCVVDLVECREFERADQDASCVPAKELRRLTFEAVPLGPRQWYSWDLRAPRPVKTAPVKGRLGLYRPDAALLRAVGLQ